MHDRFDPQRLRPTQRKQPSTASAANVYCQIECWQARAASAPLSPRPPSPPSPRRGTSHAERAPWQGSGLSEEPLTYSTKVVERNGLFPTWNEEVTWQLDNPNACLLRISVYHKGVLKEELLGTDTLPLCAVRTGYRSVFLRNAKGLQLELSALLVQLQLRERDADEWSGAGSIEEEPEPRSTSGGDSPARSILDWGDVGMVESGSAKLIDARKPSPTPPPAGAGRCNRQTAGSPPPVPTSSGSPPPVTKRPSAKQIVEDASISARPHSPHSVAI